MKPLNRRRCLSACVWLGSVCAASAGIAAILMLLPDIPDPRPRAPFAPRVRFLTEDFWGGSGASELIAVRSPALIALPNGVVRSASERSRVNWTAPAVAATNSPALFMERTPHPERGFAQAAASKLPPLDPAIPRLNTERAFSAIAGEQPSGARMTCHGELVNAEIEWRGDALAPWTTPGAFWNTMFNVRFNSDGKPVSVVLLSPASEKALNSEALRIIYQCRLKNPSGPREGRIALWFHDAGSARAPAGLHNGKGNNNGS